ncbi:MAG: ArnT family glycosyltransferase [Planctomycetota bacterium]
MTAPPNRDIRARIWSGWALLFIAALAIRLVAVFVLDAPSEAAARGAWKTGYEATSFAQSIAAGDGFANPWRRDEAPWSEPSGPSAWLPPAYPALLASLLRACGGFGVESMWALFVVQSLVSAATACVLVALGSALSARRAGVLAGWLYALYPAAIWNVRTVWDTTLSAFAFTLFLWALFAHGRGARAPRAALLGAGFGLALWVNPAPLALAPVIACVLVARAAGESRGAALLRLATFGGAALAVVLPWLVRNERTLGALSLRTNLGVELAIGNFDGAVGYHQPRLHPSFDPAEFARYRELGEVRYAAARMDEFRAWLATHPARFTELCARRVLLFWYGVAPPHDPRHEDGLRAALDPKSWVKWLQHATVGLLSLVGAGILARRGFEGRCVAAILVLFPLVYYATHVLERYRFAIEPLLVLLASVVLLALADRGRARRKAAA